MTQSAYEKDRIIRDDFGKTEMGRDLLAQDYILKQITASLIYPESNLGKKFWERIYDQAQKRFGTSDIPVSTFNKVWITPDSASVYEQDKMVYVVNQHLKVMLEEDYLSLAKHAGITSVRPQESAQTKAVNSIGSQIVREIVLPALEKEVNEGKNFANLRQLYSAMILAVWYKQALKESFLGQVYANKGRVKGVDQDPKNNTIIYKEYLRAFKRGVFNFIKEDVDKYTNETIPRKYFSGGSVPWNRESYRNDVSPASVSELKADGELPSVDRASVVTEEQYTRALVFNPELEKQGTRGLAREGAGVAEHERAAKIAALKLFQTDAAMAAKSIVQDDAFVRVIIDKVDPTKLTYRDSVSFLKLKGKANTKLQEWEEWYVNSDYLITLIEGYLGESRSSATKQGKVILNEKQGSLGEIKKLIRFNPNEKGNWTIQVEGENQDPKTKKGWLSRAIHFFSKILSQNSRILIVAAGLSLAVPQFVQGENITNYNQLQAANQSFLRRIQDGQMLAGSANYVEAHRVLKAVSVQAFLVYENAATNLVIPSRPVLQTNGEAVVILNPKELLGSTFALAGFAGINALDAQTHFSILPKPEELEKEIKFFQHMNPNWKRSLDRIRMMYEARAVVARYINSRTALDDRNASFQAQELLKNPGTNVLSGQMLEVLRLIASSVQRASNIPNKLNNAMRASDLKSFLPVVSFAIALTLLSGILYVSDSERLKNTIRFFQNLYTPSLEEAQRYNSRLLRDASPTDDDLKVFDLPKQPKSFDDTNPAAVAKPKMDVYGGIDFNAANLHLRIRRDGKGVPLPMGQQDMASLSNLEGLEPVILDIQPIKAIPFFAQLQSTSTV